MKIFQVLNPLDFMAWGGLSMPVRNKHIFPNLQKISFSNVRCLAKFQRWDEDEIDQFSADKSSDSIFYWVFKIVMICYLQAAERLSGTETLPDLRRVRRNYS